ncbi:MAG: hypothetical protein WC025_01075 [Candidatus Magasanikbacteria bacterium]
MNPMEDIDNLINGIPIEDFADLAVEQIVGIIYDRWVHIMSDKTTDNDK